MAASSLAASACCSRHWAARRAIFFGEGLAVVGLRLRANVAAGSEDVAVFTDLVQRRALAESGSVDVVAGVLPAAPGVVGVGDAGDVLGRQVPAGAVDHVPQLAGVDEENLASAVP